MTAAICRRSSLKNCMTIFQPNRYRQETNHIHAQHYFGNVLFIPLLFLFHFLKLNNVFFFIVLGGFWPIRSHAAASVPGFPERQCPVGGVAEEGRCRTGPRLLHPHIHRQEGIPRCAREGTGGRGGVDCEHQWNGHVSRHLQYGITLHVGIVMFYETSVTSYDSWWLSFLY